MRNSWRERRQKNIENDGKLLGKCRLNRLEHCGVEEECQISDGDDNF